MSDTLDHALIYARDHKQAFLQDLKALVDIPSISTLSERKPDMQRAAEWIAAQLKSFGFQSVRIMPSAGHPVIVGDWLKAGDTKPTLLYYGHYDVQPTDPIELWKSDPFDLQIRGDNAYGRGASDMKGQMVAFLKALESITRNGPLPVNLRFLAEGEEEIGSPHLAAFIREHEDLFRADLCLNGDSSIYAPEQPSITYALRGLLYLELRLHGPSADLHSGTFGGAVDNPANALCELIAGMHDGRGRVTLPGFYDRVRELSPEERADMARVAEPDRWWLGQTGVEALHGEDGYTTTERATARPTLDVNGFLSGFTGEGSKTVLPSKAMAKISMRLVADQDPQEVRESFEAYVRAHLPPTITWELVEHSRCQPAIVERDSPAVRSASRALEAVWGKAPVFTRQGGSIAIVGEIQEILGVETLLLGFGLPDDNLHAPNEKQHLPTFYRGIEAYIRFLLDYPG